MRRFVCCSTRHHHHHYYYYYYHYCCRRRCKGSSCGDHRTAGAGLPCWRRAAVASGAHACVWHSSLLLLHRANASSQAANGGEEPPQPPASLLSSSSLLSSQTADGDAGGRGESESAEPVELRFHEYFHMSDEDVHYMLLHEAHVKHGVLLNVPPQLSPSGSPPAVPDVILSAAQMERMRGLKLAYEPTHLPPPLHTTGTRQLVIDDPHVVAVATTKTMTSTTGMSKKAAPAAVVSGDSYDGALTRSGSDGGAKVSSSSSSSTTTTTVVVRRLPPDPTMRFHCSACGKAFRLEFSAQHHLKLKHPSDAAATVVEGPGAGEIIDEAAAVVTVVTPAPTTKAGSTMAAPSNATPQQNASNITVSPVKVPYTRATLTLPSEELVDELLRDVWDAVALHREDVPKENQPNAYVPFGNVVEGTADRRKEMEAQAKPTARATPEGAAPGIKKPGMLAGGAVLAGKTRAAGGTLPIKELVKKYPNPFGDSPNAALQELENEPINPFIPQEELGVQLQVARDDEHVISASEPVMGDGKDAQERLKEKLLASRPSLARSASQRRFKCPICAEHAQQGTCGADAVPSFRLLDALLDHVETLHEGQELTDAQLRALYQTQRKSAMLGPQSSIDGQSAAEGTSTDAGDPTTSNNGDKDGLVDKTIFPEELRQAVPPAPVEQHMLSVHVRASSNAVFLGRIADVQHGFLGAVSVTQYVLEVCEDTLVPAEGENATAVVKVEKEFIVIRCMGDNFPAALLKEQVKLGSIVLVQGTLRMNRHIDDASKRLHAYPFVQVVPPLGCVKVLG